MAPKAHVPSCHVPHMYRHVVEGLPTMLITVNFVGVPWKGLKAFVVGRRVTLIWSVFQEDNLINYGKDSLGGDQERRKGRVHW